MLPIKEAIRARRLLIKQLEQDVARQKRRLRSMQRYQRQGNETWNSGDARLYETHKLLYP